MMWTSFRLCFYAFLLLLLTTYVVQVEQLVWCARVSLYECKKGNGSPYSITERT